MPQISISTRNSARQMHTELTLYKGILHDQYKSFDRDLVVGSLEYVYESEELLHLQIPRELRYIVRKNLLKNLNLVQICQDLKNQATDNDTKLLLSQILKYSIKHKAEIELKELIEVLEENDSNTSVKSEIKLALEYRIKNSREKDIDPETIKQRQIDYTKPSANYPRKVVKATITKNQQVVKVNYRNSKSEESEISILGLTEILKSQRKKIKANSHSDRLPDTKKDNNGSIRSWFTTTYADVKTLYNSAKEGAIIKEGDKNYLFRTFMGRWRKITSHVFGGGVECLFIDSMIANIFSMISKKQQLEQEVIEKLIDCIGDASDVAEKFLGSSNKYDIAKMIERACKDIIRQNYQYEPQIIREVASKIKGCLTDVYDGWFSCSCKCDPNKIEPIILKVINQIRIDAITAIYNCALRDSSILTPKRLEKIQECLQDSDTKVKGFAIKILATLANSEEIDRTKLFEACLTQLENNIEVNQSIGYLNQQTTDPKRCKELFDNKAISRISNILTSNSIDNRTKIYCCEIINNCLEYSFIKGLDEPCLQTCCGILADTSVDKELKAEVLKSILLTAEKNNHLPEFVVQALMINIGILDEQAANFVVMTLGSICEKSLISNIELISHKLLDPSVIVGTNTEIKFEQRSRDNSSCTSISSIVSKICVSSLRKGVKITAKTINHLIQSLCSSDKNTRILSAKSLSIAADNVTIDDNNALIELNKYINDRVPDVAVYSTICYVTSLFKLSQSKEPLAKEHIETLSAVYAFEDLRLGDSNFTKQVNESVLSILLKEAEKTTFDDSTFEVLDRILLLGNDSDRERVIEILHVVVTKNNLIPESTIAALENVLGISKLHSQVLSVLEFVIKNKQPVGDKTLQVFADHLYLSEDQNLRDKSFSLLDTANETQDLSDQIFEVLELERAGISIANCSQDKQHAIHYLNKCTKEGQKLPIDSFKALFNEISDPLILSILANVSRNKQIIPDYLIEKLILSFDPKQQQSELIEILFNIAKNNQNISKELLLKLEYALNNEQISEQILLIFAFLGQRGEKLSDDVINKILNKFLSTEDLSIKQQCLAVIFSVVQIGDIFQNNKFDQQALIQQALIKGLKDNNQIIVKNSINCFKIFVGKVTLNPDSIEALIQKAISIDCTKDLKESICLILNSSNCKLSETQKSKLELSKLELAENRSFDQEQELLDQISSLSKLTPLLEQNFKQICSIIDNLLELELQVKAISILLQCINENKENIHNIPDSLIESVAVLMSSTTSTELNRLCHKLIDEIAKTGRILTVQVKSAITFQDKLAKQADSLVEKNQEISAVEQAILLQQPQTRRNRELLILDLVARAKVSSSEQLYFYKNWLDIEVAEQFQSNGASDKILKLLCDNHINNKLSFIQIVDVIKFLSHVKFETACSILSNNIDPYAALRQEWLSNLIKQRLPKDRINDQYINDLSSKIISKFSTNIIDRLLNRIAKIDNLKKFESLLDFAFIHEIKISDLYIQNATVEELRRSLEIKFLVDQFVGKIDRYKLSTTIDNLLGNGWTFEQLDRIFNRLNNIEPFRKKYLISQKLIYVLEILDQYKISSINYNKVCEILDKDPESWLKEVNTIAIENNFQAIGKVKNSIELVEELTSNNSSNQELMQFIDQHNLYGLIEKVKSIELKTSVLIDEQPELVISEWKQQDLENWAKKVRSNPACFEKADFLVETLAIIKRAYFLDTGFHLTDAQILSCIVALYAKEDQGRLLQIATGEGKSTIVSVLAIINALKGKKVDIITSSPVLAERDAKEKSRLYKMFGFSCSDNNDKSIYIKGVKDCYKKDIVYGEAAQFQFDTLRDEYSLLGTLDGRKCEVAIVDEVDSMLLDDSSKIARLATTVAGMDQLQPIYHFLWQRLVSIKDNVICIDGRMYLFYGKLRYEQDRIILEYPNEEGDIIQIPDLKNYLKSTEDLSNIGELIEEDIEVFIKKHLEDYVKGLIEKNIIKVPHNFKEFVEKQMPKWINNAVTAFNYQEHIHYVVQNGQINPVDYNSTGIVQSSTNWSDGLHQFLQIKHNLKMTSETFTTNFLSNVGYFKRYGTKLYGLTGTLGSEKAKQVLSEIYNVDLVSIPHLRQKQYFRLSTIVKDRENSWLEEICSSATNEANKGRGTLIICETIEHAKVIEQELREKYRASTIKLYTMNNTNQEKDIERINSGEIIIATNLAGRGTDIHTDEIEKNGGLHVVVTFMPQNQRVEEQAFGRTARQGKRGTGQMILNAVHLMDQYGETDLNKVKERRDQFESEQLKELQEKGLKVIETKDKLFKKFCLLLNRIRRNIREKRSLWKQIKDTILDLVTNVTPSIYETNILAAIEEKWAMFLRKIDNEEITIENADSEYKKFEEEAWGCYNNENNIKNPYYHIAIANDLIINDLSSDDKYDLAIKHFDQAIKCDKDCNAAAFVGKAWLLLKKQRTNYKQEAIIEFEKALGVLDNEISSLYAMQTILQQRSVDVKSDLAKQLIQKITILGSYINSIQNAIAVIKKTQRLVDITGTSKETTRSYYGIERNRDKTINQNLEGYDDFELIFNDLTTREDCGTRDQAIDTVNGAFRSSKWGFSSSLLSSGYKDISIRIKQLSAERLERLKVLHKEISTNSIENEQFDVSFDKLGQTEAIALILEIRKENIDFSLVFNHLNNKQLHEIIRQASLDQEDIEISRVKTISELFMGETKATLELSEFAIRGIEYLLEINEKRFIPYRSICAVCALAGIQMAIGGVLIYTGFGATVGIGLITEGVADLFTAYRAYSTRQFTWSDYMKQKVVSLTISAVSMGWGKLKDAGRGIKNLVVGAGKEVLEQAGTRVVTNGRAIGQTLVQSGKNLKSLVFKQIGVSVGEAATREVLNKAADTLSHFALEQFKPQISESIQCKVNAKFCGSSLMSLMRKMHILDMINHSHNLKRRIDKIVAEVISPEHNFWRKQWDSVGGPLCKGILSDSKYLGSPFSMGIRILGTLNGLQQITFIIDNFYNQLVKKLSSIDQETSFMAQLLHLHCDIDLSDAKGIVSMLQAQGVIDENEDLVFTDHKIEINCGDKYSHYKLQIVEFLNWLGEEISNGSVDDFSMIIKSVSDVITDQIIRVTESQLISPWSSYGIGEFTSVISARIQDKMIKSQILEEINSIDKKLKALEQKENLTAGDVNKIRELKAERSEKCKLISSPQTYSSVINHEAKQYTIAYSQCENIHYVQQKQKGNNTCKVISQEIMERIENTKSNKPADVADLIVLADENGLRVKIVDDPNYQPTEEEKSSDTKIIVFRKGEKDSENTDQIGHYQLKDSDGSLIDIQSNGNDCGYAVIAHLTGKPIQQLREEVVHFIKNNIFNFEKIVEAQQWIQTHYPQEANSLLLVGGEGVENDECDDQKGLFFLAQNAYQNKNPAVVSSKETTAPTEVSEKGIKLIKRYEGLKLRAYRCQAKVLTIGYGHTKGVKPGQQITSEKAEKLLLQDIKKHTNKIVISLKQAGASVNQNQLDALVSLSFNIGICAFLSSTLFRRIREKDYARAALEFGKWNKITSNGKKVESNGLTRRRAAEKKLFETPPRSAQISPNPVTLQPNRYSRLRCC